MRSGGSFFSPLRRAPQPVCSCGFGAVQCRGEDSNLCCLAELSLQVGDPLRDGLRELAIVGLVVALTILSPVVAWTVVYAGALWADLLAARWCAAQWRDPMVEVSA